jgi:multidrug resistance protein, MATE family
LKPGKPAVNSAGQAALDQSTYGLRALLRLAWPASLSFLLNGAYRINDQYWIQGLGQNAQSAAGGVMFVAIMNFAVGFLAAAGALSLSARAIGAGSKERADSIARHALLLAGGLGLVAMLIGPWLTPTIVSLLGLGGQTAEFANDYLGGLYLVALPMFLAPTLDNLFIGRGRSRIPMVLQGLAVSSNFLLSPILIYGGKAADAMPNAPFAQTLGSIAQALGISGGGLSGAAYATGTSRLLAVLLGLWLLKQELQVKLFTGRRPQRALWFEILRLSAPMSLSIALYAGVYWAVLGLVLSQLPDEVKAGLAIGFQVFEGISYPLFLGLSIATAALIGRALGAGRPDLALLVLTRARRAAIGLAMLFTLSFLVLAEVVAARFAADEDVLREAVLYVRILAYSQFFVGMEAIHEKALLGAGLTRPIPWISGTGNLLRIPLTWAFAIPLGGGAAGVWWAINLTSGLKALLFWRRVRRNDWTRRLGAKLEGGSA